MKVTALVPSKLNSQRLPTKNIRMLGGRPLVNYILDILNRADSVEEVYLYASDDSICKWIELETARIGHCLILVQIGVRFSSN